jgi:hypothetical protein
VLLGSAAGGWLARHRGNDLGDLVVTWLRRARLGLLAPTAGGWFGRTTPEVSHDRYPP